MKKNLLAPSLISILLFSAALLPKILIQPQMFCFQKKAVAYSSAQIPTPPKQQHFNNC
ncbi:MAG: hypothetical protein V4585_18720 [Bacteroidota bacterium]